MFAVDRARSGRRKALISFAYHLSDVVDRITSIALHVAKFAVTHGETACAVQLGG